MHRSRNRWNGVAVWPVMVALSLLGATPGASEAQGRTAVEAARWLRERYVLQDFNTAADTGTALVRRFPADQRVAAWWALNLQRTAHADRADSVAARLDTTGRDPMVTGLATYAQLYGTRTGLATQKRLTARLGAMAQRTRSEDLAEMFITMSNRLNASDYDKAAAVADSIARVFGNTPLLRGKVLQGRFYAVRFGKNARDTATANGFVRELMQVAQAHPDDARLLQLASDAASYADRDDLELQYTTMLMARAPRSSALRSAYWDALNGVKSLTPDERKGLIDLDRRAWLAMMDSTPWAMSTVLSSLRRTHKGSPDIAALERRIEARAPRTAWHERILEARVSAWNDSLRAAADTTKPGPRPDSLKARAAYRAAMDGFFDKGWTAQRSLSTSMAISYYAQLMGDSTGPTEPLVRIARRMLAHEELNGPWLVMAARSLADRGVALPLADSLVRKGEAISAEQVLTLPARSIGEQAEALDQVKADAQDALGWSAFKAGRVADAEKHFAKGIELTKRNALLYLHLGRMRLAQGQPDAAELAWAEGMTVKARGPNPNRAELEALYRVKHGSLEGWSGYVAALEEKERTVRKARILAKVEEKPFAPPALADVLLSGDSVHTAALAGKTVVVNFWGTWCGPCVAEMPELQQFYDKYRGDSTVRVLTVSNDSEREVLVKWLAERKHTLPTVWSKGYTTAAGVSAWPTTWFIGPDGRVRYQMVGNAGQLVEEWSWIVEALRSAPVRP